MYHLIARPALLVCALAAPPAAQLLPAQVAQARQSSQIRLRCASFDPLLGLPAMPEELRGVTEGGLWMVQFHTTPTAADRRALAGLGGQIVSYLPDNTYVVRMPALAAANTLSVASVRSIGSYEVAFRVDPALLAGKVYTSGKVARYNIVVADKHHDKPALIAKITTIGGNVEDLHFGSILIEASLTGAQLLAVAGMDEVLWVDAWSAPELDMDNARIQGGGNYIESQAGYTGAGVNAHVYEGVESGHVDFTGGATDVQSAGTAEQHGHATAGIVWGNGTSNPAVRGMAPDCGKFFTEYNSVLVSRYQVFDDLVNIHNVSHTSASWGDALTFNYTSISAESDDIVFDHDLTWTQSQSNAGNQDSRPQAWAKNVFSIGGVDHNDDANPANDSWLNSSASIGPAADGRIKPDMTAYYDDIGTSDLSGIAGYSGTNWTAGFGGTSGATPIVAGHNVLAIQMFTDDSASPGVGAFGNTLRSAGGTAHENRPHFTTLKALQIVNGNQYPFTAASTDNRREHQGWGGFPSLANMWDNRAKTFIVDETSVLDPGVMDVWQITVATGEPELKVSLHWNEPAGNPGAAQVLVNDLSLRVLDPNGNQYWGNVGLEDGVWSITGGSEDTINSVENVFVQNPVAGDWFVQVMASSLVMDNHMETPAVDADYGLVCVGGPGQVAPSGTFAEVETIGFGCDGASCADAIYEYPSFSLANSSITFQYVNGDYVFLPGQGTWIPASGSNLGLGDNTEVIRNLGFTMPYPGGSTNQIRICSNGWIVDGQFTGASNILPDVSAFLAHAMWAPLWHDLNPSAGGSVWFDASTTVTTVTWVTVPNFFNSGSSTFQVQFWINGDVHFLYQNISVSGDYLTGFSQDTTNDPGSVVMATAAGSGLGVCTNAAPELSFSVSAPPVLGTTFDLVTSDLPVSTIFGLAILSTTPINPGASLTPLGMSGCELYQTIDVSVLWGPNGNTAVVSWPLPTTPSLAGFVVYCQSVALVPGINPFGMAISNGLKLTVGLN